LEPSSIATALLRALLYVCDQRHRHLLHPRRSSTWSQVSPLPRPALPRTPRPKSLIDPTIALPGLGHHGTLLLDRHRRFSRPGRSPQSAANCSTLRQSDPPNRDRHLLRRSPSGARGAPARPRRLSLHYQGGTAALILSIDGLHPECIESLYVVPRTDRKRVLVRQRCSRDGHRGGTASSPRRGDGPMPGKSRGPLVRSTDAFVTGVPGVPGGTTATGANHFSGPGRDGPGIPTSCQGANAKEGPRPEGIGDRAVRRHESARRDPPAGTMSEEAAGTNRRDVSWSTAPRS